MTQPSRKLVKVVGKLGGGPPPGYKWRVYSYDPSFDESRKILDDDQYAHIVSQIREIAGLDDPTTSETVDIRAVEDFYELRDKGGILKKINLRVFFFLHEDERAIVIIGVIKKENEDQTQSHVKTLMRNRKRKCLDFIANKKS